MENSIKHKLYLFIRKFNLNILVRGVLISIALLLGLYLVLSIGEYTFRFGQTSRTIIFWGFVSVLFIVSYLWIVKPLLKLWRLRKSIDENQAALIIGTHFKDIEDRLLNLLQLEQSLFCHANLHTSHHLDLHKLQNLPEWSQDA